MQQQSQKSDTIKLQRILEYKLDKKVIKLSTNEIINRLEVFILDEIDYKADKFYMLSDKLFERKTNREGFKIECF